MSTVFCSRDFLKRCSTMEWQRQQRGQQHQEGHVEEVPDDCVGEVANRHQEPTAHLSDQHELMHHHHQQQQTPQDDGSHHHLLQTQQTIAHQHPTQQLDEPVDQPVETEVYDDLADMSRYNQQEVATTTQHHTTTNDNEDNNNFTQAVAAAAASYGIPSHFHTAVERRALAGANGSALYGRCPFFSTNDVVDTSHNQQVNNVQTTSTNDEAASILQNNQYEEPLSVPVVDGDTQVVIGNETAVSTDRTHQADGTIHLSHTRQSIQHQPPTTQQSFVSDTPMLNTTLVANLALASQDPEASHARQAMNALLKQQSNANLEIIRAEEDLKRAQERLDAAQQNRVTIDERIIAGAESLTDALLKENTRWNAMYRKLVAYKEQYGHCDVQRNPFRVDNGGKKVKRRQHDAESSEQLSLGTWVGQIRAEVRRPANHPERLEPYKVIALNRIGFDWQPRANYWMEMYEQLKEYLQKSGGKMPPRVIKNEKFALGVWCESQLDNYRKFNSGKKGGHITQEKIDMLNQIG